MSVREVQTAAARVLHADRADDKAIQELKSRFHYHPLDIEALFTVPVESNFSTYGDYALVTWLWPDAKTNDVQDLRFFVDTKQLTIIGDTSQHEVADFVTELHNHLGTAESQLSAPELVHELLQRLRRPWAEHHFGLSPVAQHHLIGDAQVLRQLGRWLQAIQSPAVVPQLVIDAHALDSLAERPAPAPTISQPSTIQAVPAVLRGYAVASAVMVIVVIVTLSVK